MDAEKLVIRELVNIGATVGLIKGLHSLVKTDSELIEDVSVEATKLFDLEAERCPVRKDDRCTLNTLDNPMCCLGVCQLDKIASKH